MVHTIQFNMLRLILSLPKKKIDFNMICTPYVGLAELRADILNTRTVMGAIQETCRHARNDSYKYYSLRGNVSRLKVLFSLMYNV